MDDVKKKVLLELFVSPWTVLPLAGGLSAWMLSWATGGSTTLNLAGLAGVLGGFGMLATRLIFGIEEITHKAYAFLYDQQRRQREAALDALDAKLSSDNDQRSEHCLRELRHLYQIVQDQVQEGSISGSAHHILEKVEQLFQACVRQLERSYELWRAAEKLTGRARQTMLRERDEIVQEVSESIQQLAASVEQLNSFKFRQDEAELAKLREELDVSMRVARRAEQRMASLGTDSPEQAEPE